MKKLIALLLCITVIFCFGACAPSEPTEEPSTPPSESVEPEETTNPEESQEPVEETELIVFAAASMTETLDQAIALYKDAAPEVAITATYDSSGTLKTQIEEGADCDIFISAAQKQMNQLDIAADPEVNTDGLDFVLSDTRFNLLENKVVLVVPEGNPAGIKSFDDIKDCELIALGNEDVPVGSYSLEILDYLGLDVAEMENKGVITYGSNVKEVTTQVSEGVVDCGIVYATDAYSAGLEVVDTATTDMCKQVIYPAAVLNISKNVEAAENFLSFLKSDQCAPLFEEVGFTMVAE